MGAGNPASRVARAVGCSRSNVSYWKDKFVSIGVLENRFGMVLSDVGVPLHDPITRFYSEEAKELVRKFGTTIVEDVGSIDESLPEKIEHEEYRGRDLGKARLLVPLNVRRLEKRLGNVEEKVDKLSSDVHELVDVLKEALCAQ